MIMAPLVLILGEGESATPRIPIFPGGPCDFSP